MTEWEVMEDNEEIKAEFQGYKEGMVRLKEGGWAMLPSTAAMIDTYKVQQCNHTNTAWAILQLFSFAINSRTVPVLVVGLQIPPTTTSYKYVVILTRRNIIFRLWR